MKRMSESKEILQEYLKYRYHSEARKKKPSHIMKK